MPTPSSLLLFMLVSATSLSSISAAVHRRLPIAFTQISSHKSHRVASYSPSNSHSTSAMKRSGESPSRQSKKSKSQASIAGFFGGGGSSSKSASSSTTTSKLSAQSTSSEATSSASASEYKYRVYCDLDGVLVDFDRGVKQLFNGRGPDELPNQGMMWGAIHKTDFYAKLHWMPNAKSLWNALLTLPTPPDILTGVPRSNKSRSEKFAWCKKELGTEVNHLDMAGKKNAHEVVTGRRRSGVVNVITCWSKNKHYESRENQ